MTWWHVVAMSCALAGSPDGLSPPGQVCRQETLPTAYGSEDQCRRAIPFAASTDAYDRARSVALGQRPPARRSLDCARDDETPAAPWPGELRR